jgi:hypothetical protein
MDVGNSVRKAISDFEQGEIEAAMIHACNAVDGTAAKVLPQISGNNLRFTTLLRTSYFILGPMAAPGINLDETRWPVKVERPKAQGGKPDFADIIYGIHRCCHGHGEALPDGFELLNHAAGSPGFTALRLEKGKAHLSDRIIFGLLAVAVLSPANVDQRVPDGYHLTFGQNPVKCLEINQWWGRAADFPAVAALHPMPLVKLDFGDMMDDL